MSHYPRLEPVEEVVACDYCEGTGSLLDSEGDDRDCPLCGGSGNEPRARVLLARLEGRMSPMPIIDECDLSESGRYCVGPEIGCITCQTVDWARYTMLDMDTWALACQECGEAITSW